ncbi:MAG: hypothetical protein J6Q89_04635 [Clostridia bacterium]|nr:hypothetical protein [Clostridia bacterium]
MSIIIFFIIAALSLATIWAILTQHRNKAFILEKFIKGNIIVAGKKGKGKDLFFNYVINARKSKCRSNIQFNPNLCEKTDLDYLTLKDENGKQLEYSDFLNGKFKPIKKDIDECVDYYISDGGVFLPSQFQAELCKKYPSLPITYALSRHLARMNIHANTQNLNRLWDKLREQADGYFIMRKSINLGLFFLQKTTYYDDYHRALSNLRPFHSNRLLSSKENKALAENFRAQNGLIMDLWIIQPNKRIAYDTREFHKQIYGEPAPNKEARRFRRLRREKTIVNAPFDANE